MSSILTYVRFVLILLILSLVLRKTFLLLLEVDIHDELKVLQEINPLMTELCFSLIFYTYLKMDFNRLPTHFAWRPH